MASKSKAELATDVLRKLTVVDALETPSAQDSAYVEDQYDHKYAELRDKGLAYWTNTDRSTEEIPLVVFGALVDIMCEDVAGAFGLKTPSDTDDVGRQVSCGTKGLRNLRAHVAKRPSGESTKAVYF